MPLTLRISVGGALVRGLLEIELGIVDLGALAELGCQLLLELFELSHCVLLELHMIFFKLQSFDFDICFV